MGTFSNLSPDAFLIISLLVSYVVTKSEDDVDEQLSFSNFLILIAFVMKNDAQQEELFIRRKERAHLAELEENINTLSTEVEALKSQLNIMNIENNRKK